MVAYGAGWTDPGRQPPIGDTGRHEPRQADAIKDAELDRAFADPFRSEASRGSPPAFVLAARGSPALRCSPQSTSRAGVRDALPGVEGALRAAVREFMRLMLSPARVALQIIVLKTGHVTPGAPTESAS
jgi:hypothetical protein